MSNTVIHIENVSKLYRLGLVSTRSLAHDVNRWWYRVRGKEDPYLKIGQSNQRDSKVMAEYVWAVKDINLEVSQGEVLGVIGKNGAGKSTLLKILSRITNPTTGQIKVRGRIASLLEVGTGFHPELTGRENIYLNGAILGMRKHEIQRRFDEIVDFSGCELYIDTPVKRYSSGMSVRLAFAVAAHLDPEILIFDEVLAVGDAQFQKKSLGKMHDVAGQGRTVLFVSHNMTAVQTLCDKAMLLVDGMQTLIGPAGSVVQEYLRTSFNVHSEAKWSDVAGAPGDDIIRVSSMSVVNGDEPGSGLIAMHRPIRIIIRFLVLRAGHMAHITLHLVNDHGITVLTTGSPSMIYESGMHEITCEIPPNLLNTGGYYLNLLIVQDKARVTDRRDEVIAFTVMESEEREAGYMGREPCVVLPRLSWTCQPIAPAAAIGDKPGAMPAHIQAT